MRSRDGLALALLALLSKTLTLAQYVTTVTVSINDNPLCTPVNSIGALGTSVGGAGGAGSLSGSRTSTMNGSGGEDSGNTPGTDGSNGSGEIISASPAALPAVDTSSGRWDALGWYDIPADGILLGGPISTSPVMTVELCGTNCDGYTYLALENGNECNCGSSAPISPKSSSPPSKNKRQVTSISCIPCAGNSTQCCGAPGSYALLYHFAPYVEGSSVIAYTSTNSAGSIIKASFTTYSPNFSPLLIAHTSPGSDGSVILGSSTSYGVVALSSPYTYNSIYLAGLTSVILFTNSVPNVSAPTGSGSGSGSGSRYSSVSSTSRPNYISANTGVTSITSVTSSGNIPGAGSTATINTASTSNAANRGSSGANSGNNGATGTTQNGNNGSNAGTGGATVASNGGGIPEPTVTATLSCAKSSNYASNNTKYNDYNGYTYDIRCNLDIQSVPSDGHAHADNFEDCLEYCSFLTDCIAVTYQDPPHIPNNFSNCFPKWSFGGYTASVGDGLYSGVNINGASPGTLEIEDLCSTNNTQGESYDGTTYYDDFGMAWTVGCDRTVVISATAALSTTITDTLASCVDYCSVYESCSMVNWTGPRTKDTVNAPNCFPASSAGTAGSPGSALGSAYAILNP